MQTPDVSLTDYTLTECYPPAMLIRNLLMGERLRVQRDQEVAFMTISAANDRILSGEWQDFPTSLRDAQVTRSAAQADQRACGMKLRDIHRALTWAESMR